ncbi:MAG: fibronectin type III-like domain-contianing protein [Thermoanaerobacterium sp.]|nr:fibronectin type III-like domain-contianing protein [Thermoanaerobacterium sp.]
MKCVKEYRLSYTERAKKIVDSLTLEEKVHLMSGTMSLERMIKDMKEDPERHYNYVPYPAGGIKEKGIPPLLFCDGPRGVVCGTGKSTCFPVPMLRGATFDVNLEERIGRAIGKEIRAYGGNFFGGVCINLPYNPGWGRSQETYTGDRDGAEVVQMYVGFKNSKVDRPVKLLRGFKRVELKAGESKQVSISCPVEKLCWYNPETNAWELEKMDYEVYIGTSSDNRDLLQGKITLN